jgi:hypothetical protein
MSGGFSRMSREARLIALAKTTSKLTAFNAAKAESSFIQLVH